MSGAPQYLLAIYIAQQRHDPPVQPGVLAEMLDRSPASATEMCQRLADDGLVSYEPYDGVTLTDSGQERARQLHETYATISWFFRSVLGLDDHETEAMEMAGLVSPTVAERLAATLPHDTETGTVSESEDSPMEDTDRSA